MNIVKATANCRFFYHTNMLDICNVLNQLGILKDDRAEEVMKRHTMKSLDCVRITKGYNSIEEMLEKARN